VRTRAAQRARVRENVPTPSFRLRTTGGQRPKEVRKEPAVRSPHIDDNRFSLINAPRKRLAFTQLDPAEIPNYKSRIP